MKLMILVVTDFSLAAYTTMAMPVVAEPVDKLAEIQAHSSLYDIPSLNQLP